jgi:phosphoribosylaminoimidazolecarboxamide formyltransferase/IMP cyclohydrolase
MRIERALLTVHDKEGIIELARGLTGFGVEIISTGGTLAALKEAGIIVTAVSDITGFPEILDGRVKTLHPKIFGGILARRDSWDHMSQIEELGVRRIDLVAVNLYPFEKTMALSDVTEEIAIEKIDIGGPALIRAAAKNYRDVTIITAPTDYAALLEEMKKNAGTTSLEFRQSMATAAFARTAAYDSVINAYFNNQSDGFPQSLILPFQLSSSLRYGENPHQMAAMYASQDFAYSSIVKGKLLSGKELSFNNIWDLEAGLQMALDFNEPFAAVIKHANPCGAAIGESLAHAYEKALASDPLSAFGSVIALNRRVDIETAGLLHETDFIECIVAPGFEPSSLDLLRKKKNRRLLEIGDLRRTPESEYEYRPIIGGLLAQTPDRMKVEQNDLKCVTRLKPTEEQIDELLFAFKVVKYIKSNAIVVCRNKATVGVGPGQTSRVDSSIIAVRKAGERARGAVAASDAFFPMPDGLEVLAEAGVGAIIQPGGSKQDQSVISAADRLGVAMVLTGVRHFKH